MIVANPIHSVCPEERRVYPACAVYPESRREFSRSERTRSTRPWAQSAILSAAKDPGPIASAPVSDPPFSSPNLDALDAASSLSPLSATLAKNSGGWGHRQAPARNPTSFPTVIRCESVSISIHGTYASFVFILLRTLLHCQKRYLQSFHGFPHSLHETPGVGTPRLLTDPRSTHILPMRGLP